MEQSIRCLDIHHVHFNLKGLAWSTYKPSDNSMVVCIDVGCVHVLASNDKYNWFFPVWCIISVTEIWQGDLCLCRWPFCVILQGFCHKCSIRWTRQKNDFFKGTIITEVFKCCVFTYLGCIPWSVVENKPLGNLQEEGGKRHMRGEGAGLWDLGAQSPPCLLLMPYLQPYWVRTCLLLQAACELHT